MLGPVLGAKAVVRLNGYVFSPLLPMVTVLLGYAVLTILKTWKIQHQEKEKADEALVLLKTSESNLSSIIKTIPDIVFRLDQSGRITFISPAVTKYVGQPDHLVGRPIFDLVAPQDVEKAQFRINERRTGQRATNDLELRLSLSGASTEKKEADYRYFSISAEGIYNEDNPRTKSFVGTQGIARDITEQKKLEEQLRQAQKMETVGNLAAGVAHDLNNILSGLVSYPDLLLLEIPSDSPLRETVNTIQQSGQKAAAIVQDLLTFARRGVAVNEVFNLNTIIADYMDSVEFNSICRQHPDVIVKEQLAADLMDVKGSPVHLSKALMNLVNNAAEAMPAGGHIRLRTANRYVDAPISGYEDIPEGEYVYLSVADEGVGISAADLKRIFEPFYTRKAMHHSGSGLGMTVVWATIKDHQGYIDVQSKEGDGTLIGLYLPATRETADKRVDRITLEDYLGTEHILVVDDMPEQLTIAEKMLTKLGYEVATAPSGEAAVTYLSRHRVDLVVLDMIMPGGMDGLETYQRMIEQHPGQKAIIASGYSESERVKRLQKLGAGVYVQKPYTLEKIGLAIRQELDR
jgi:PAS domain S-box-containing protein